MTIFENISTYGYLALGFGLAMLVVSAVAVARNAKRMTMVRICAWCLFPVIIGYAGAISGAYAARKEYSQPGMVVTPELVEAASGCGPVRNPIYLGIIGGSPGMVLSAVGFALATARRRSAAVAAGRSRDTEKSREQDG